MRPVPTEAVDFVAQEESCDDTAYLDRGGVPTIGYGHTGPNVALGDVWTDEMSRQALLDDLTTAATRLGSCVKEETLMSLSTNQYAALLSFVFNVGDNPTWSLWEAVESGQPASVPPHLAMFNKVRIDGQLVVSKGLTNRRQAEIDLWNRA